MTSRSEMTEEGVSPYYWIPSAVLGSIICIFTLVYASMYTAGFVRTCNQYRQELVKYMHASGDLVAAIQGRISCAAVFDFMDYLHPDVNFYRRRENRINTGAALHIAIITAWFCVVLWFIVIVINIKQSRESKKVRV